MNSETAKDSKLETNKLDQMFLNSLVFYAHMLLLRYPFLLAVLIQSLFNKHC